MLIGFLGRGLTKNQYRGGSCRKREGLDILHFADLMGGFVRKRRGVLLRGGGLIPKCPLRAEGKETVDIDILVTSWNDDNKIMQYIRITSSPTSRIRKWNQFSQFR